MWREFWFQDIDARQYALLRILVGGLSLMYFLQLWPYLADHFSRNGWLDDTGQIAAHNGGSWSLFFVNLGDHELLVARLIAGVGTIAALDMTVGCLSRFSTLLTWLVWVSLWNRNPLILDGDDALLKLMCFYLLLSACGYVWSVDAKLRICPTSVPVWPLRLMQFQIALIYFISGWVKLHSAEWDDGRALQYVLIHPQYSRWDGWDFIHHDWVKPILAMLAQFIRWWEVLFPLFLLHPLTRKLTIAIGIVFHLGLALTMNLRWFPMIMLALYPALLTTEEFLLLTQQARRILLRVTGVLKK